MAIFFSKTSPEYISIVTASHIQGLEDDLVISNYRYKANYYISHNPLPFSMKITFILKVYLKRNASSDYRGIYSCQILGRNKYCICFYAHIYCIVMPQCNTTWVDKPSSHKLTFKRITTAFMQHDKA